MSEYFNDSYPFYVDEKVVIKKPVRGLEEGKVYTIRQINRGIDGACDYDDIYLEGIPDKSFCEFDFRRVKP